MTTRVIYHAQCPDGFCAAWAVWRAKGEKGITYEPWQYGQPPPENVSGQHLIVVDFSFKRPVMERLIEESASLLCLDHHKTAEADLAGLPGCHFDMNRSGAAMAWDYFHGDVHPRPWVVDYVQDRDLWRWALPNSREVSAWTMAQPHTFEAWNALLKSGSWQAIQMGSAIRTHIRHYCEHMVKHARYGVVGGISMPVVNAPMFNVSDLLHEVCAEHDGGNGVASCAWWQRGDGRFQHSLRSTGELDVSEIAKQYGGGGHKNAAGFESARCEVKWDTE